MPSRPPHRKIRHSASASDAVPADHPGQSRIAPPREAAGLEAGVAESIASLKTPTAAVPQPSQL